MPRTRQVFTAEPLEPRRLLSSGILLNANNGPVDPAELVAYNGVTYFTASAPQHGRELWRTDGSSAGTVIVRDILIGKASSSPEQLTVAGGSLYFVAHAAKGEKMLWKTDGTEAGTNPVQHLVNGAPKDVLWPGELRELNGQLMFTAPGGLWKTDGTAAGTVPIAANTLRSIPKAPVVVGNKMYFSTTSENSARLWKTDGSDKGTYPLKSFRTAGNNEPARELTGVGKTLYFIIKSSTYRYDLWKSDGTPLGTIPVQQDLQDLTGLRNIGDTLFYATKNGKELWRTKGTSATTNRITTDGPMMLRGYPDLLIESGGSAYFSGPGGLWKSDGTANGTVRLTDLHLPAENLRSFDGKVYFSIPAPGGVTQLWQSGGTTRGTRQVPIFPGKGQKIQRYDVLNGQILLTAKHDVMRLWRVGLNEGIIRGLVYLDFNGDGKRAGDEVGLEGYRVFIDRNANGIWESNETSARTDGKGGFFFAGLKPGTYRIAQVRVGGMSTAQSQLVTVEATQTSSIEFGNLQDQHTDRRNASISGYVFRDYNNNGTIDAGEAGAAGIRVFLDTNRNGRPDPGEPSTRTDSDGHYVIGDVAAGTHQLRIIVPSGWSTEHSTATSVLLAPGGTSTRSFGIRQHAYVTGVLFDDRNANGVRDAGEPPLSGVTVVLSGTEARWPPIDVAPPPVDIPLPVNPPPADVPPPPGELHPPVPPLHAAPLGTLVSDLVVVWPPGIDEVRRQTTTDANGNFRFEVFAGTYSLTAASPGWRVTANPTSIHATDGATASGNVGVSNTVIIRGTVFHDANADGKRITSMEGGMRAWRVYLDQNDNGVLDAGELSALTTAAGEFRFGPLTAGEYRLRYQAPDRTWGGVTGDVHAVQLGPGETITRHFAVAQKALISGTVFDDRNDDRSRDPEEPTVPGITVFLDANRNGKHDAGERIAVTDALGRYEFANVFAGERDVRVIAPEGHRASATTHAVKTTAGKVTTHSLGITRRGLIQGRIFLDRNGNGMRDGYETYAGPWRIYIDSNNNRRFDPESERSVYHDGSTGFTFRNLGAGTYTLCAIAEHPFTMAPITLTLKHGGEISGLHIAATLI